MDIERASSQSVSSSLVIGFFLASVFLFWSWGISRNADLGGPHSSLPTLRIPAIFVPEPREEPESVSRGVRYTVEPIEISEDPGARGALNRALAAAEDGELEEALSELATVRESMPGIEDRLAFLEAELRSNGGEDEATCAAFRAATDSPNRALAARARVAWTRCLLAVGDRRSVNALSDLRRAYPRLPQTLEIDLLRAAERAQRGDLNGAVELYRDIDLRNPGRPEAVEARERLVELAARGAHVPALTPAQRIRRIKQLARTGPLEMAREEIVDLRSLRLTRRTRAEISLIEAGMARREGRFDEARALVDESLRLSSSSDARELRERLRVRPSTPDTTAEAERARRRISGITKGRPFFRQSSIQLLMIVRIAAQEGLSEEIDQAIDVLVQRRNVHSSLKVDVAIAALGIGDDERIVQLLTGVSRLPGTGLTAQYYRARALERLGRTAEATAEFQQVVERDDGVTPFYGFLAGQRIRAMAAATPAEQGEAEGQTAAEARDTRNARNANTPAAREARRRELLAEDQRVAATLRPLAEEHGEAYPWLPRALSLVELGRRGDATDELHEVYLAWANSRSRKQHRTGLLSIYRGGKIPRHRMGPETRRGRRALDRAELETLADVCAGLGDHGLAVRFGGWDRANERPRAYEELVNRAAERHGVDPGLLLAVMRVESVYNPRIISYAGAIGLMQIMPRTGGFIARQLGQQDFTVDRLLEPETNIDFAAWYLASLIERFDGRVPLAVASYNGGPHNVRLWLRGQSPDMPLDAFLETIPFGQTHRYVRRVLTHYEAYRSQLGGHVPEQDLTLPSLGADRVAF